MQDTLDIIAYADPSTFTTSGYGTGAGYPYDSMYNAASALTGGAYPWDNVFMVWGTEAGNNGIEE